MKYKNRVLHVMGALNTGGQETLMMNIYRNIQKDKMQFDFSVVSKEEGFYEAEIEELGGKVYHVISSGENRFKYITQMYKLFQKYNIVHIHTSSAKIVLIVILAKMAGCKKVIVHSHNTSCENIFIHKATRNLLKYFKIIRIACSNRAGKWMFKNNEFVVLNNGIEVEKYKYDENKRKTKRRELNIKEKDFVVGNIGRLVEEKNHERLIEIFEEIINRVDNAKLLIIGSGILEKKIENKIKSDKLEDKIILLKNRNDINELLQIMDVFVLPSKYEGLPVTLIEAQASGLKIIVSDRVTQEVRITKLIKFKKLEDTNKSWADTICECLNCNINRDAYNEVVLKSGYDIKETTHKLLKIYEK